MSPKAEDTDEALMVRYQLGDSSAFDLLYRRNSNRVYAYIARRLKRREEAEDVFQQVFVKLHGTRERYDSKFALSQWLFVLTKSVLSDHWRKSGRLMDQPLAVAPEETGAYLEAASSDVLPDVGSGDYAAKTMLSQLPEDQRKAIEWRVLDEDSYEEIARRLNRPEATVRQTVSRGLKKLRWSWAGGGKG